MRLVLAWTVLAALAAGELVSMPAATWRVTRGRIEAGSDGRARVQEPKMRAVAPQSDGDAAELRFVYQGPSATTALLGSGELRRQIGLKLRAQDGCNLLYVMWRIEPKPQIVVSTKLNPGQSTHAQCGTRGYTNLRPRAGVQPAPLVPGSAHALHAVLDGRILRVWADRALAWEGDVGDQVAMLRGPAGLRSDNVQVDVELRARPAGAGERRAFSGTDEEED